MLELLPRTVGNIARDVPVSVVRELVASDLDVLKEPRGGKVVAITELKQRHHSLARALASGMNQREAGLYCGYTDSRVSILLDSPAFIELVAYYRGKVDEQYIDMHRRLASVSLTALNELEERLEDVPKDFTPAQLTALVELGADRTGFGPSSSSMNVNVNVGTADRLAAARKRVVDHKINQARLGSGIVVGTDRSADSSERGTLEGDD